jgi:glucose dehydrogenase
MRRIDLLVVIALLACTQGTLGTQGTSGTAKGEWTHYGGNAASHKYSPLDQINKDNIGKLAIAWRWASLDNAVDEANPTARPGGYAE